MICRPFLYVNKAQIVLIISGRSCFFLLITPGMS